MPWICLGDAAARVVEGARSRMERKSEAGDDGPPARLAVARDREGSASGEEDASRIAGGERHAAASRDEPHCEAMASAMPAKVRERSFQRSGPGGMR